MSTSGATEGSIARNALSDVRHRYAGSAIGVAWNVLNPLAQILIYSLVFSHLMASRVPGTGSGAAFALYLCAGLLPWAAFSDCVLRGANAFIENAQYLKKLPIPEQVFVAQNAAAATLFLGISMALLDRAARGDEIEILKAKLNAIESTVGWRLYRRSPLA